MRTLFALLITALLAGLVGSWFQEAGGTAINRHLSRCSRCVANSERGGDMGCPEYRETVVRLYGRFPDRMNSPEFLGPRPAPQPDREALGGMMQEISGGRS